MGLDLLKLAGLGVIVMIIRRPGAGLYVLLLWLGLVLPFIVGGRLIFSRYLAVSAFPPSIAIGALVVAAAWIPGAMAQRMNLPPKRLAAIVGAILAATLLVVAVAPAIQASSSMVSDPLQAHLPESERAQYRFRVVLGCGRTRCRRVSNRGQSFRSDHCLAGGRNARVGRSLLLVSCAESQARDRAGPGIQSR